MPQAQITLNLDELDDPLIPDAVPSFEGGQFSNQRANLLQPSQSKGLLNCDIDKLGQIRTRRGTIRLGAGSLPGGSYIQGIGNFNTFGYNYIVAANGRKLYNYDGVSAWTQIATGGVQDNDLITFGRLGNVNHAGGYNILDTTFTVDGFVGSVYNGQSFVFINANKNDAFTYVVTGHFESGGNTIQITIADPGLVAPIYDNWQLLVFQTANVNLVGGYPGGATTITIDNHSGAVNNGATFYIENENLKHTVLAHVETGGNTTSIDFTPAIQGAYVANDAIAPIVMAQGNDKLFWCDGIGTVYGWDGRHTLSLANGHLADQFTTDDISNGLPPVAPKSLVWFQSRLIAAGMQNEPDTIYFSDFLDATRWDRQFQSLRVGGGESDPIVALAPWTDLNMLVLKNNSLYTVNCDPGQNPVPEDVTQLVSSFAIKKIHGAIGCSAPFSVVQAGGGGGTGALGSDVFFLDGQKKLRSIRRVIAAEAQQEVGLPISFPVQDVFDRITPSYINRCVATYYNDRYIIALPVDGAVYPNIVMVYNLLTQTWCGKWTGWIPTCFAPRTPVTDFVKLCFGQSDGTVFQWLDDLGTTSETDSTYQDNGVDYPTSIFTRALTGGDPFNPKTGLNAEFEFSESVADVSIQTFLEGIVQPGLLAPVFSSRSSPPITLPVTLPFTLPVLAVARKSFDLQRYGQFREMQFYITSSSKKLSLRSIRTTMFLDSIILQT